VAKQTVGYFRLSLLALVCLGAGARPIAAAPHTGEIMSMEQPDGSQVDVRLFGDEFYVRGEGVDGFTVMRDPHTGAICYAVLNADGTEWLSTGLVYQGVDAGGTGGSASYSNLSNLSTPSNPSAASKSSASSASAVHSVLASRGITPGLDLKPEARRRIRARAARELGLDAAPEGSADASNGPAPLGKTASPSSNVAASAEDSVKKVTGVIILVEFPDVRATFTKEQISDMANLAGFNVNGNNGSIRDYFLDVSHGRFEYALAVTEYYMARNNKDYYDRADGYAGGQELIKEAMQGLEAKGYDFSKLTTSSTGTVRGVNVLFAGASGKVWAQGLWAHRGNIPTLNFDGVKVSGYMLAYVGTALTIGTFVHESGHLLFGWPDLYDYDSDSRGAGSYCLMSGQHAKNPQPPNAHLRAGQGWEPMVDLKSVPDDLVKAPSNGRASYRFANPANAKESYVIENIAKKGRWANMPDDGLMIWHVDDGGNNSWQDRTLARHYRVSVVQADGKFDLERNVNGGGANDLFHSGNNAAFTAETAPDSKWWSGSESGLNLIDISAVKDTMTFQIQGMTVGLAGGRGKSGGQGGAAGLLGGPGKGGYVWRMDGRRAPLPQGPAARK
jgi:M6 family metalloprotease-like protein